LRRGQGEVGAGDGGHRFECLVHQVVFFDSGFFGWLEKGRHY